MGLEDNINSILQIIREVQSTLQDPSLMGSELQTSIQNLSVLLLGIEEKFDTQIKSITQTLDTIKFNPELQTSIQQLPNVISSLEESLRAIQKTFETTTEETRNDLKFIKVSYVEDVVVNMRNLSQEITEIVQNSVEKTNQLYEASVESFTPIQEHLNKIENSLNALIENQTDQLTTVAELRDRVNAIIQVELASLRDRIAIYLEASVNELKTSVTERLANQEGILQRLANANQQLNQTVAALPEMIKQEIDNAVESKIIQELNSMKKETKKMSAFVISEMKKRTS
ncbi:MAG: hypothetical protein ACFFAU_06775 [Candidatus Hodarchaeota archaeon]